jgi:protein-arginine kinase activator protein McsA
MSAAGIVVEEPREMAEEIKTKTKKSVKSAYENLTMEELKDLLKKSVDNEEYEKASKIRDEIKRKEKEL